MAKRYIYAVGRRKETTAIVKLYPGGSGKFTVFHGNTSHDIKTFFGGNIYLYEKAIAPFKALGNDFLTRYDADIIVRGGGISGIADAVRLGFARSLIDNDPQFRSTLKPLGFLMRDQRVKERKKFGLKKARKSPKRSKR